MLQSCEDDVLTGQPSWLGNSIYERLQDEGTYQYTLRLIDDLDQTAVLSQTGSRTLFVADDAAYERWFASDNLWGVKSYEELTLAQKKLLLNSAMVKNAYLVELLSNVSGTPPLTGMAMRRPSAVTIYDSVPVIKPAEMPALTGLEDSPGPQSWNKHREKTEGIILMKDATPAPMIHFLPAFMEYNKITDEDLSILTNGVATSTSEAWVNGKQIIERDITCKNGYIHKVADVIEPMSNMAEIIREHDNMSTWSRLIDRFSAPYYSESVTRSYRALYGGNDSIYVLRYFSEWGSQGTSKTYETPDGELVANLLKFDPGWNEYMYSNTMGYDLHYDAGVMIVPTDSALHEWLYGEDGEGKALLTQFGGWDGIPDLTLKELINANMVESFSDKVPSKFDNILDASTQLPLGIEPEDVVASYMGCNGVVYLVDKVFAPKSYSSVSFPAMIREETLNVIYWAADELEFLPYLNSMDSKYSVILPTNNALLTYVDPISYGENKSSMLEFSYDNTQKKVVASRYDCTVDEYGNVTKGLRTQASVGDDVVENRLSDLLDQIIIVGEVEAGKHTYYKSKGGSYVRVENHGVEGSMSFAGAWQMEHDMKLPVQTFYNASNGRSYEVDNMMPLGATKSVYMTLREHSQEEGNDQYSEFLELMLGGDPKSPKTNMLVSSTGTTTKYTCANPTDNNNVRLFENYNYTVYVPTNEAIRDLIDRGILPTWEDFNEADTLYDESEGTDLYSKVAREVIKDRITNFIRYHLQDNSLMIGSEPVTNDYETMLINPANGRFYSLGVNLTNDDLTVEDQLGNVRHVVKTDGLYNNICREYWFKGSGNARTIYMNSDAILHQIDGVLMYEDLKPWKTEVAEKVTEQL